MQVAFYDALGGLIAYDTLTGPTDTLAVYATFPAALDYKFVVSGDVTGTLGGSYGGVVQLLTVPETESWVLLLAGLGILAGGHLRRNPDVARSALA